MKKFFIATVMMAMVLALGGCGKKDKTVEADQVATENTIDFAELLSSKGTEQAVRMPNSEATVYIEGISQEEADALNNALRQYEEAAGAEVDETSEWAYLYSQIGPAIESWFDPSVDTIADFKAVLHDTTGTLAWLTQPLEQALAREDCANAFYFTQREDGNYTMSYGYYLVGYAHSSTWQLLQTEQ